MYEEFQSTQHANATIFKDEIHAAVWAKHPKHLKAKKYGCAKCHTPAADDLHKLKQKGVAFLPDSTNPTHMEAVSCAYCHRIESIEHGKKMNRNIISKIDEKRYFGNRPDHIASPFHQIAINNKSSHALTLHPMRVMKLLVTVKRGSEEIKLPVKIFLRAIGANGKPTPPWLAKEIVKDTSIKANEKRVIKYNFKLQKGDEVTVTLGYYLVNPKLIKKLNLQKSEIATKFYILKKQHFTIH